MQTLINLKKILKETGASNLTREERNSYLYIVNSYKASFGLDETLTQYEKSAMKKLILEVEQLLFPKTTRLKQYISTLAIGRDTIIDKEDELLKKFFTEEELHNPENDTYKQDLWQAKYFIEGMSRGREKVSSTNIDEIDEVVSIIEKQLIKNDIFDDSFEGVIDLSILTPKEPKVRRRHRLIGKIFGYKK